jgi:hypothetical protein
MRSNGTRLCLAFQCIRDDVKSGHVGTCPADTDGGSQDQSPPKAIRHERETKMG